MTSEREEEVQMAVDVTTWLTTGQAAKALGVSTTRVLALARSGRLPHIRTGHGRLFDPAGVDALLRNRD